MKFLYPLGLWGLLGIPVLIIIYLIKNKYTEQTVPSTYLWTLSERFLKRKNPINRITGIISLILQILIVLCISMGIAHPVIVLPGEADEFCFVLDASGSMNIQKNGKSRFERGKDEIASLIDESLDGSIYSLVCVGDATTVVFEKLADKEQAKLLLDEIESSHIAVDFTDALGVAQGRFNENNSALTYLFTDTDYEQHDNVKIVNLSDGEENYAVSDLTFELVEGVLTVRGQVSASVADASLGLELYINETPEAAAKTTVATAELQGTFALSCAATDFRSAKVKITNADALALDNESVLYNVESENSYKTLIVSDRPFFLESVLNAVGNAEVEVVGTENYNGESGYGLYVFDSFTPSAVPEDGSVWFFNITDGEGLDGAGFSVQGEVPLEVGEPLTASDSSSTTVKKLLKDVDGGNIYISNKYVKYGLYANFTTLFSCQGQPIVFTGENEYGNREVVFAFDLHDSNFALLADYVALTRNLLDFSFPEVIEETSYTCGEKLQMNVLPSSDDVKIKSPSGTVSYFTNNSAVREFALNEAGVYEITMTVAGTPRYYHVYAELPKEESTSSAAQATFSLQGEAGSDGLDGKFDNLMILFICLAVIFIAEWAVYCYDKYQLR